MDKETAKQEVPDWPKNRINLNSIYLLKDEAKELLNNHSKGKGTSIEKKLARQIEHYHAKYLKD